MSVKYSMVPWSRNATIYEVNMRQYTKEGTIAAFRKHLPRIKSLGVKILWFMPMQPIGLKKRKSQLGSYYSIKNYHEINPEFGTFEEFVNLVDEIHKMGMYVILDWVANHTAWDHNWVDEKPEFYKKNEFNEIYPPFPEWEDVVALNYDNKELRKQMILEMKFWLEKAHIDGFRCDMANLVPTDFWNEARAEIIENDSNVLMLAEAEQKSLLDEAFDIIYNWPLFHNMKAVAYSKCSVSDFTNLIIDKFYEFPENCSQLLFISNHDENSWNGSELERLGLYLEAMALIIFTLPGIPLIYSGMEAGNNKRLAFFTKDFIEWKEDKMFAFYNKLTEFRLSSSLSFNDNSDSNFQIINQNENSQILCYTRFNDEQQIVVICNLSSIRTNFTLYDQAFNKKYTELFSEKEYLLEGALNINLPAYGYMFLYS